MQTRADARIAQLGTLDDRLPTGDPGFGLPKKAGTRRAKRDVAMEALADGDVEAWNSARAKDPGWTPQLTRLNLSRLGLGGADFRRARLQGSTFAHSDLSEARFDHADVRGVSFESADLTSSRFIEANVDGASFAGADLDYANFAGARSLTAAQLRQARSIEKVYRERARPAHAAPSIFLSYAWQDKGPVMAVDQWLRDRGARVIVDERNFVAGETIRDEILRWIAEAGVIVVFVSTASKDRPYPRLERELADVMRGKGTARVIYFNLDDTILDMAHESRLYVAGHRLSFEQACEHLWQAVGKEVREPRQVDLQRFKQAGAAWTRIDVSERS